MFSGLFQKQKDKEITKYLKELKKIEAHFLRLNEEISLRNQRCLNLESEKTLFFDSLADGLVYNPQFVYEEFLIDKRSLNASEKLYRNIDLKHDIFSLKKIYKEKLKNFISSVYAHLHWGQPASTDYVVQVKGKPSWFLLQQAKSYCRNYKTKLVKRRKIKAEILGKKLQAYVLDKTGEELELRYTSGMPSKVNISPFHHTLDINPEAKLFQRDVERLKAHEIDVHFMRYFNAKKLDFHIFEVGTAHYLETEEGLAVYNEDRLGVLKKSQMFLYAGRVIAAYYTLKKSFYEIFNILKSYGFKDNDAFNITFRVKRNICDTSQAGGFTKDYVYFSGYNKIKKYARKHKIKDLFYGKYAVEDLPKIKKYLKYKGVLKK